MTRLFDRPDHRHNEHDSARIVACAGVRDRETTVRHVRRLTAKAAAR